MDHASPKEDGRIEEAGFEEAASNPGEVVDKRVSLNSAQDAAFRISIRKTLHRLEDQYKSLKFLPQQLQPRNFAEELVAGWKFRWAVFSVIFLNMAIISVVEGIWEHEEVAAVTLTVERLALVFYMAEWLIRLHAGQLRSRPWWMLLDAVLILIGIIALLIPSPLCVATKMCTSLQRYMLIVRLLRLLKIVQISKEERRFNAMWILFDGVLLALPTIMATTVVMAIMIAVFAGLLNALLREDEELLIDPVLADLVQQKFSTFPRSLLSLVQFVSGDNLSDLYYPLMVAKPELALIFIPLLIIVTVGLMSLVPAILFENQSKEKERRQIEGQHMFRRVTDEIEKVFKNGGIREITRGKISAADINESVIRDFNFAELFEILASKLCPNQEDPALRVDEFLDAVIEVFVFETPLSTIETLAQLRRLSSRVGRVEADLGLIITNQQKFQESMQSTQKILESLHQKVDSLQEATMNPCLPDVDSTVDTFEM